MTICAKCAEEAAKVITELESHEPDLIFHDAMHELGAREGETFHELAYRKAEEIKQLTALKLPAGGQCANCGFRYFEHEGHIIPCPRCELAAERERAERLHKALTEASAYVRLYDTSASTLLWQRILAELAAKEEKKL